MGVFEENLDIFEAVNRQVWRDWLQQHHETKERNLAHIL